MSNDLFLSKGILVLLLDTGIRWGHEEFTNDPNTQSRIICGFDAFNWYDDPKDWNNGCYDGVGHGTHIAGIIGGAVYVRDVINIFFSPIFFMY